MENCKDCGNPLPWDMRDCPHCGTSQELPNVRHAASEFPALEQRYQSSLADCQKRSADSVAHDFMQNVKNNSHAVINGEALFFRNFFHNNSALYGAYAAQTRAGLRTSAGFENDSRRRSNEATAFGAYGEEIRYAALSLDTRGLYSYGNCCMVLKQGYCANKASLLEENSFDFVERVERRKTTLPQGFRARWSQRHLLALAKLGGKLDASTNAGSYAALLLHCAGERATDQFLEVHIYGAFSALAVDTATLPLNGGNKTERFDLETLFDTLTAKGLPCQRL